MTRFFTETGMEVPAVTADQMREIDRIAMEETGPNLFQMMENAGRNLASLTMELLGDRWDKAKILVLAGTGGNGGGGICAARHLANREVDVRLCLTSPEKLKQVPKFQYRIYKNTAGQEMPVNELNNEKFDLIIDALIGYSLQGAPSGTVLKLIRWANQAKTPILSLDVPSGLDSTNGKAPGEYVRAEWTMTLALPKTGFFSGKTNILYLADIAIPAVTFRKISLKYKTPFGNKYYVRLFTL